MSSDDYLARLARLSKGRLPGIPLLSKEDIDARITSVVKMNRERDGGRGAISPEQEEWIRESAHEAFDLHVRTMSDSEIDNRLIPRSGRFRMSFPYRDEDGDLFVRKVSLGIFGMEENAHQVWLCTEADLIWGHVPDQYFVDQSDGFGSIIDCEYVRPLTKAELDSLDTLPDWLVVIQDTDKVFGSQVGVRESTGELLIYDPQGDGNNRMWDALEDLYEDGL